MTFFLVFFIFLIFQRLTELLLAKKNERRMKELGALEFGKLHYYFMTGMHSLFFAALFAEVMISRRGMNSLWVLLFTGFLLAQAARVWVISSLGQFWNTKIIILPEAKLTTKGPYKFIKHPNYLIVTLELLIIPFMFNAYLTMIIFAILNAVILSIRIPLEERALILVDDHVEGHLHKNRFFPKLSK
ncbi:isoprenylcysteine carboxyl methyltransferase family protein [Falsibacillus pallidus]|uniref:15-methylpalmitoyl-4-hydroxy-2-pyrone 4-O-methyltransferase n=1 Tax=Falsibacillus pallidus TaxID=493781 RepID=A0A370GGW8_9BACI|nr:isoprenylcysteine carboxylmethyltransferase family protein [Falsibacillus pallidus]RDI43048.1 15-methylpalmitoyl-4-hydroxy-2-pyrone 4-O-methyltransferase [Falsibacillus pallidus]